MFQNSGKVTKSGSKIFISIHFFLEIELLDFVDDDEEKRAIHLRFLSNHILPMMTYIPEQKRHGTQEKEYHDLSEANLAFHNATT